MRLSLPFRFRLLCTAAAVAAEGGPTRTGALFAVAFCSTCQARRPQKKSCRDDQQMRALDGERSLARALFASIQHEKPPVRVPDIPEMQSSRRGDPEMRGAGEGVVVSPSPCGDVRAVPNNKRTNYTAN